jgi:hypothetical protein
VIKGIPPGSPIKKGANAMVLPPRLGVFLVAGVAGVMAAWLGAQGSRIIQSARGQAAQPVGSVALLAQADAPTPPQAGGAKPNVLVIMGDDIGWFNPSC